MITERGEREEVQGDDGLARSLGLWLIRPGAQERPGVGVLTDSRHFDYWTRPEEEEENRAERVPRVWGVVCDCWCVCRLRWSMNKDNYRRKAKAK